MEVILSLCVVCLAAGRGGSSAAPVGAPPLLLFPPSPPTAPAATSTTPAAEQPDAVPVIHLPPGGGGDARKVSAEHYLDLLPPDLLATNNKLRPVDVKVIEHKDFIDYEVEFVEIGENDESDPNEDIGSRNVTGSSSRTRALAPNDKVTVTTDSDNTTTISNWELSSVNSFVKLLHTARQHMRKRINKNIAKQDDSDDKDDPGAMKHDRIRLWDRETTRKPTINFSQSSTEQSQITHNINNRSWTTNNMSETTTSRPETTNNISTVLNNMSETTTKKSETTNISIISKTSETTNNMSMITNKMAKTTNDMAETSKKMPETINNIAEPTNNISETINNLSETINNISDTTNIKFQTIRRIRPDRTSTRSQVTKVASIRPHVSKSRSRTRQDTTATPVKAEETNKRIATLRTKSHRLSTTSTTTTPSTHLPIANRKQRKSSKQPKLRKFKRRRNKVRVGPNSTFKSRQRKRLPMRSQRSRLRVKSGQLKIFSDGQRLRKIGRTTTMKPSDRTSTTHGDNLYTTEGSNLEGREPIVVTRNVTSTRLVTSQPYFEMSTTPVGKDIEPTTPSSAKRKPSGLSTTTTMITTTTTTKSTSTSGTTTAETTKTTLTLTTATAAVTTEITSTETNFPQKLPTNLIETLEHESVPMSKSEMKSKSPNKRKMVVSHLHMPESSGAENNGAGLSKHRIVSSKDEEDGDTGLFKLGLVSNDILGSSINRHQSNNERKGSSTHSVQSPTRMDKGNELTKPRPISAKEEDSEAQTSKEKLEAMPRESYDADEETAGQRLPALREEPRQSDIITRQSAILTLSDMYSNVGDTSQTDTRRENLHIVESSHLVQQTTEPTPTTTKLVKTTLSDIIEENFTESPQTTTETITTSNNGWEPEDVTSLTLTDGKTTMRSLSTAGMTTEETVRNPTTTSKTTLATSTKMSHAMTTTRTPTIGTTWLTSTSSVPTPRTEKLTTQRTPPSSVKIITQRKTSLSHHSTEATIRPESTADTTKLEARTTAPTTRITTKEEEKTEESSKTATEMLKTTAAAPTKSSSNRKALIKMTTPSTNELSTLAEESSTTTLGSTPTVKKTPETTSTTTSTPSDVELLDVSTVQQPVSNSQTMQPQFARLELPRTSQNLDNNGIQEQRSISIKQTNVTESGAEEVPEEVGTMSVGKTLTIDPGRLEAGQYHEINPGQYHEVNNGSEKRNRVNPGQYHEENPGQYHEVNPGQYHEINPGQDLETQYSQYHVDNYEVDLNLKDNAKVYNIEAKVGGFIVGETGRIDQGQTSEGVRWTILEGAIDDHILASLLGHFGFGKRISRTARPDRLR